MGQVHLDTVPGGTCEEWGRATPGWAQEDGDCHRGWGHRHGTPGCWGLAPPGLPLPPQRCWRVTGHQVAFPGCPSPPRRTKGRAEARKRPGAEGPSRPASPGGRGRARSPAAPRKGGEGLGRPPQGPRRPSPPPRALRREGCRGRWTQCNSSGGTEGGREGARGPHNEAGGSPRR